MSQISATRVTALVLAAWLIPIPGLAGPPAADPAQVYARVDIDAVGPGSLEEIKQAPGVAWWVEAGDRLLVLAGEPALASLERRWAVERLALEPRPERLYLLRGAHRDDLAAMEVDILVAGGRHAVVQARRGGRPALPAAAEAGATHLALLPFEPNLVLARQLANRPPPTAALAPSAAELIDEVDEQRWLADLTALAGFNRYTHGPEIDAARDWLAEQLAALPGLEVTTESFPVPNPPGSSTIAWNVIATLPGSLRPEDLYIVGGHYDATSETPLSAAPGAEDNASGCAGVLEMARIFAAHPPLATILFICYSGEEQGLRGSTDHASGLAIGGLDDQVRAVLIMDMIGFTADLDLDCLLETSAANAALVEAFTAAAELTELRILISFNPFGSDHVPYLTLGMPALLTIENDAQQYPCYHRTCDLPDRIVPAMGREILRMNVVAMSQMIGFETPIFGDGFESGDTTAWAETYVGP